MHMYAGFRESALIKRASLLHIVNIALSINDMLADRWQGDNKEHYCYLDPGSFDRFLKICRILWAQSVIIRISINTLINRTF